MNTVPGTGTVQYRNNMIVQVIGVSNSYRFVNCPPSFEQEAFYFLEYYFTFAPK